MEPRRRDRGIHGDRAVGEGHVRGRDRQRRARRPADGDPVERAAGVNREPGPARRDVDLEVAEGYGAARGVESRPAIGGYLGLVGTLARDVDGVADDWIGEAAASAEAAGTQLDGV